MKPSAQAHAKKPHLFGWLSDIKLKTKLLLILFLTVLIVFLCTFLTARIPYASYDSQLYLRSVQMISLFSDQLQSEMARVSDATFSILGDNVLQKNLTIMKTSAPATNDWLEARREVQQRLENLVYINSDILTLQLLTRDAVLFTCARRGNPVPSHELDKLVISAIRKGGREIWAPDTVDENSLICARDVREVNDLTLDSLGVIILRVDLGRMIGRCSASLSDMGMPLSMAIYDGESRIYASEDMKAQVGHMEDGYQRLTIDGQDTLCVAFTSSTTGWQFVTTVPYGGISNAIVQSTRLALTLSLAAMAVALLLGYLLISSILRHFEMLLKKFGDFSQGRFPIYDTKDDPYHDRKDEIGSLHRQFGEMARSYNQMIEDNYVKQQLLLEAQFHQLRAQVRPHFLFNTLESIYCLAKTADDERIATMTEALGKMLRASLKDTRDIITVGEDMNIVHDYLRIQLLRYGDRLTLAYDIPPPLLPVRIPSMTLQPLVENAVLHAVEEMMEECRISIYGREAEDGVDIIVENNGPDMDEDILQKLESGEIQPGGMGIGLRNIQRRLQIAFSEDYGLRIESGGGITRVIVHLPGKEDEDEDQAVTGG